MIEAHALTKHYGETVAVDQLSFEVRPGQVTGFLGPNGSGKSTTMRMIMGLDNPNSGSVQVNGRPFRRLPWPLREVGALLEDGVQREIALQDSGVIREDGHQIGVKPKDF